jgi:Na+-translocating ferredoxin:NAD+ oxidoreductase RnfG subunit
MKKKKCGLCGAVPVLPVILGMAAVFGFVLLADAADSQNKSKVELIDEKMLQDAMGDLVEIKFKDSPFPHALIFEKRTPGKISAYLFNSGDMRLSAKGCRDDVDVYIITSPKGTIISVMLGDNKEFPKYIELLINSPFLKSWKGKKSGDEIPESLTGATFTSNAVRQSVLAVLEKLNGINFFK